MLRNIEHRIEGELTRPVQIEKSGRAIRKHSEKISEEIRKGASRSRSCWTRPAARSRLDVEFPDESTGGASPLALPNDSLEHAVEGLPSAADAAE